MKIIAFNRLPGEPVSRFTSVEVIPDSAMILTGRPLFLPDFASVSWHGSVSLAYRINRLGKTIAPRFAPRYYDAMTLALRAQPDETTEPSAMECRTLLSATDGTFYHGDWLPLPSDASLPVSAAGTLLSASDVAVDQAIAFASDYMTLKTGDIILPVTLPLAIPLAIGSTISLDLNSENRFNLRIK